MCVKGKVGEESHQGSPGCFSRCHVVTGGDEVVNKHCSRFLYSLIHSVEMKGRTERV